MIEQLKLDAALWYQWTETVLEQKRECRMPSKTSLHFGEGGYFNTMPGILPMVDAMGTKAVNRYIGRTPSLESQLLLYRYSTGELLALMDANYITAMRTGAAAVHSMQLLARPGFKEVGITGFGNIGTAVMKVMTDHFKDRELKVRLLRYKNHADKILENFRHCKNIEFVIVDSMEEMIKNSDVILSCITYTDQLLGREEWFREGCLVLPVHLRGFQNCDLFFDKVFGDDREQLLGFQYFHQFRYFAEITDVLHGKKEGRTNGRERILCYNMGMSIQDIFAASQIYPYFETKDDIKTGPGSRYWLLEEGEGLG